MKWHKKDNSIYFTTEEIERFFRMLREQELEKEIEGRGVSWKDLEQNPKIGSEIANFIGKQISTNKEEFEIFLAADVFVHHFPKDSEIGFFLKDSYCPETNQFRSFQDLKEAVKENCITDFLVMETEHEVRQFQLKRYMESLTTEPFFKFLKKRVAHYCNDLQGIHLLVLLQPYKSKMLGIDFSEINKRLLKIRPKIKGEILITYNQENKLNVLRRIYPVVNGKKSLLKHSFGNSRN